MKYFADKILFVFCLLSLFSLSVYATSEAEYGKLSKNWILHEDGSQEFHYSMELTLFTHTAMNGTYGESFIVYNPEYETLKINSSYTRQKNGNVIQTPANAFVEVLPRNAADAPAYNGLKEMVVVHTGLELGATICLDYTITRKVGYLPELDLYETIRQSSPVKEYSLSVSVPESKRLQYEFYGLRIEPVVSEANGQKVYTWTLHNVKAMSRLADVYHFDEPILAANTYASSESMAMTFMKQMDNDESFSSLQDLSEELTACAKTDTEKLKAIYGYIQHSFAHIPLDLKTCGYRIRPVMDVIRSAYGTDAELVNVFQGLLHAVGLKADVCAVFPRQEVTGVGLKPLKLYVRTEVDGRKHLLAPTSQASMEIFCLRQYCPTLDLATGAIETAQFQKSSICYNADLTLKDEQSFLKVEAKVADVYLDVEGKVARNITRHDKNAQTRAEGLSTVFNYECEAGVRKVGRYQILSLPDFPFSAVHNTWMTGSERDIELTLPMAYDETYIYKVHLGGKILCTPVTDLKLNNSVGKVEITVHPESDGAIVKRVLKLKKTQISPKEYPAYLELIRTWIDENHTQLLVR